MIYSSEKPFSLNGENEAAMRTPIKATMVSPDQKLDESSRLNYAKLYTVEHNVKVHFIGQVHPDWEQKVVVDYNNVHQPLPARPTPSYSYIDTADGYNIDQPEPSSENITEPTPTKGKERDYTDQLSEISIS